MKYLVSLALVVPLLTGCYVVEEEYYGPGPGYYNPPPPPVVVTPTYYPRHYYDQRGYRPVPHGRVYRGNQGYYRGQQNVHGHPQNGGGVVHGHPNNGGGVVHGHPNNQGGVVHGHPSVNMQPSNVHGHEPVAQNVHSHDDSPAIRGSQRSGVIAQNNTHGHN